MIDSLIEASLNQYQSSFLIKDDNLFLEGNAINEYALIENIAQTGTAGIAFERSKDKIPVSEGFIGGVSKLSSIKSPKIGETIKTIVVKKAELDNLILLSGKVFLKDELIFQCELKLAGKKT